MPCTGQNGILALGTIHGEEVEWFVVSIIQAYWNHDMTESDIGRARKGLLNPELLELYLSAFLCFLFPLATFLVFLLVGKASTAMFELNLCTQRPALAKVITQIDDSMGYVETSVTGVVLMFFRLTLPADIITIIIA